MSRSARAWRVIAVGLFVTGTMARASFAQSSVQIPLQFDFLNPGAKSLALGGAFAGLADDATATFANPAGLTQLGASEFSIEGRVTRVSTAFLQRGRLSGPVSNVQSDTIQGPIFGDSTGTHAGPGFLAGVYVHPSRQWVVAGYRHELVRVDQSYLANGVFQKDSTSVNSARDISQSGVRQVSITAYGVSGSYKLASELAVGASLTAYSFNMDSTFTRLNTEGNGFAGEALPNSPISGAVATQRGDNIAWAPTVGVMIGRDARRFGVVYRHGASFDIASQSVGIGTRAGLFRVPDTLAFGASTRIKPPLTLAVEVTRVWYSRLREDFITDQARGTGHPDLFSLNDGTEIHAGVQYALPRLRGVPRFRGGAWYDPDHSVKFTPGAATTAADRLFNELFSTALSKGKNQVHGTAGIGLTFGRHVEFNAAFDGSSTTRIFSSSLIVR